MRIDTEYYIERFKVISQEKDKTIKDVFQLEGKINIKREFLLYNLKQEFGVTDEDEDRFDYAHRD